MTTVPPIEELLRETLNRLVRQEQRTAALEAALFVPNSLTQTPTARSSETPVALWPAPRRTERPSSDRVPPAPGTAVSPGAVVDSLDDVVWSVSPDGQLVFFAGGAVERLYGLTAHELQDQCGRWLGAIPADDRERFRAALARLTDTGTFALEHRVERASGSVRWAVTRGKLVRDSEGAPVRVDGTTADATRRGRTRDAVLAVLDGTGPSTGNEFLGKLAQHLCAACDARAAVIVEPLAHGEARAAVVWLDGRAAAPFTFAATAGPVRDLLAGGSVFVPASARDHFPADQFLLKLRAEAFAAEPLIDATGRLLGFIAIADDRAFDPDTDARAVLRALAPRAAVELARGTEPAKPCELEARLAEAERRAASAEGALRATANLAAAGRLAAGVAHDFHNLLGVIVGNADLIREVLPAGVPEREYAEVIARTAHTVAAVSRQLVSVGKPCAPNPAPLDVAAALRALDPMLQRLTGRKIALAFDLAAGLPLVCADATDFDRVLLNLVLNARDASRTGDGITVRAARAHVEAERAGWPADRAPGEYVAVTVADQGCGMSAEVRAKMFDLFFTTKGDRGTGLGLATVRDAVAAVRGHIEVESEPGWGTTIRVYWPALPEPNRPRAAHQAE